jgi:septal ring-binding cell division protein DamX
MSYITDLKRSYKRYRLYNRYSNPVNVFLVDVLWHAGPVVLALLVLALGHSFYTSLVQNRQAQLQSADYGASNVVAESGNVATGAVERVGSQLAGTDERAASGDLPTDTSGQATLESTLQAAKQAALHGAGRNATQVAAEPASLQQASVTGQGAASDQQATGGVPVQPNVLIEVANATGSGDGAAADAEEITTAVDDALSETAEPESAALEADSIVQPDVAASAPAILNDSWIFEQDESKYTVQFGSSASRELLREFASEFPQGTELVIYQLRRASVDSEFGMVHGVFDSIRDATEALDAFPQEVLRYEPWIRRFSDLKTKVRATE